MICMHCGTIYVFYLDFYLDSTILLPQTDIGYVFPVRETLATSNERHVGSHDRLSRSSEAFQKKARESAEEFTWFKIFASRGRLAMNTMVLDT